MSRFFTLASVVCLGGFFYYTVHLNIEGALGMFACTVASFLIP